MGKPGNDAHDLAIGHIYLELSARMTSKQIAEIAGVAEAEVQRLVRLTNVVESNLRPLAIHEVRQADTA